jgi:hypothetical protein
MNHHRNEQQRQVEEEAEESPKEKLKRKKLQHQIGGLTCEAQYGGPSYEVAAEMVYWNDIPSDHHFKNPFHTADDTEQNNKYLTFEPDADAGDWNNQRTGLETAAVLALISGRIWCFRLPRN